ncbi:MAG: hypothetical protein O3A46_17790 [Candidatus Poribacteria bacterium]|nr:hypothetical protein [Candidatus Poribacteria bacterium]
MTHPDSYIAPADTSRRAEIEITTWLSSVPAQCAGDDIMSPCNIVEHAETR